MRIKEHTWLGYLTGANAHQALALWLRNNKSEIVTNYYSGHTYMMASFNTKDDSPLSLEDISSLKKCPYISRLVPPPTYFGQWTVNFHLGCFISIEELVKHFRTFIEEYCLTSEIIIQENKVSLHGMVVCATRESINFFQNFPVVTNIVYNPTTERVLQREFQDLNTED